MKPLAAVLFLLLICTFGKAQSLIGRWQLTKQTSCLDDKMGSEDESIQELIDEKSGMSAATPQVIEFKKDNSGEENTRILNKKKTSNNKSFLYKFDGANLYILDKKSRTLSETYTVDRLEGESLILSNSGRACETKIFVRLK
ncbi:MAG: hypothetical protein JNM57_15165 [Cyclobacteriaceae bacterium]|nr:hypothetical protein [Cyclobacteriaceae bacterium]